MQNFSSKNFDSVKIGYCIGCNCGCKYIAYIKDNKIVDVTGHPLDILGMGSFCTKGIALTQELPFSPFRLKISKPMDIKENTAIYVDKFTTDEELQRAFSFTDKVYSNMLYVPKTKTFELNKIPNKNLILNISEPSYYDVMLSRWIIDALQKGAKVFSIGTHYTNMMFKASYKKLLNTKEFLRFLEQIKNSLEKGTSENLLIDKFVNFHSKLQNSLIIIQDTYIRMNRDFIIELLEYLYKNYKIDYIITGNVTTWPVKSLSEFEELEESDSIINVGDMFRFLPEKVVENISKKPILTLSHMANMSVNLSSHYLPRKFFTEMDFFKKTAFLEVDSQHTIENDFGYTLLDVIPKKTNEPNLNFDIKSQEQTYEGDIFLMVSPTIVDDIGHYSRWLHEIEPYQYAYINNTFANKINIRDDELLEIKTSYGKAVFRVKISANVSGDTIFISDAFDEYQPFYEGVRPGVLAIDKSFLSVLAYKKL